MNEKILKVVKELREKSKKRNFPQGFDLIVNLKELDLKKAENKFSEDVVLPHGRGENASVIVFSDSVKEVGADVLSSGEIEKFARDKREARKISNGTDFFLADVKLMPLVGKNLGQFLAPRGKMPKIISGDLKSLVENYKKSVRIKVKDSPVIQCSVGNEKMKDDEVAENVEAILRFLESRLPKGKHNIKEVLLKMTMGQPVKVGV